MTSGCSAFGEGLGSTGTGSSIVRPLWSLLSWYQNVPLVGLPSGTSPKCPPISPQVTLSYGVFEGKLNVIKLQGPFSHEEDPSRCVWAEVQDGGGDQA